MVEDLTQFELMGAGQTGEADEKHLTFWVDGQLMGVSIADVVQIVGIQPITPIPDFPAYCKGIINLRGSMIPLVDLRLRFGKAEVEYTERTCVIVCNIGGREFGYIVDGVDEVADIPEELISPPPQMGGDAANRYLTGIARLADSASEKIVLMIDAAKVLGGDEFDLLALST